MFAAHTVGRPCRAAVRPGSAYCAFHDPALAERRREMQREGGRRRSRPAAVLADADDMPTATIADVTILLGRALNDVRQRKGRSQDWERHRLPEFGAAAGASGRRAGNADHRAGAAGRRREDSVVTIRRARLARLESALPPGPCRQCASADRLARYSAMTTPELFELQAICRSARERTGSPESVSCSRCGRPTTTWLLTPEEARRFAELLSTATAGKGLS